MIGKVFDRIFIVDHRFSMCFYVLDVSNIAFLVVFKGIEVLLFFG